MQQYVIFNVLKEYCIPKEEEERRGLYLVLENEEHFFEAYSTSLNEINNACVWNHLFLLIDSILTTMTCILPSLVCFLSMTVI